MYSVPDPWSEKKIQQNQPSGQTTLLFGLGCGEITSLSLECVPPQIVARTYYYAIQDEGFPGAREFRPQAPGPQGRFGHV
jgi:hypothetical protein